MRFLHTHCVLIRRLVRGICLATAVTAGADPYVVKERVAVLYEGRTVKGELPRGEIIQATLHPTDRDWLKVQVQGRVYDAAGFQFQSRDAALETLRRKAESGEESATALGKKIDAQAARAMQLWYAVNAVRFDGTILYKITVTPAQGAIVVPGGTVDNANPTFVPASFRYDDKIEPGRAKRLIKEWQTELAGLDKELQQWRTACRTQRQTRFESEVAREQLEFRFKQFEVSGRSTTPEPYVVTGSEPAVLFQERQRKTQLEPDTVVLAVPHPADPTWLQVQLQKQWYDGRATSFLPRTEEETEYRLRSGLDQERLHDLDGEAAGLEQRETFLASLQLALKYESNLTRYPLSAHPIERGFPGQRLYNVPTVPSGVVEIVDTSRAKRVLKDWEAERTAVRADITARANEQTELRRRISAREQRHSRMQEKFGKLPSPPVP